MRNLIFFLLVAGFLSCAKEPQSVAGTYLVNSYFYWELHEDGSLIEYLPDHSDGGCGEWWMSYDKLYLTSNLMKDLLVGDLDKTSYGYIFETDSQTFKLERQ